MNIFMQNYQVWKHVLRHMWHVSARHKGNCPTTYAVAKSRLLHVTLTRICNMTIYRCVLSILMLHLSHDCEEDTEIYSSRENHISRGQCPKEIWFSLDEWIFVSPECLCNKLFIIPKKTGDYLIHWVLKGFMLLQSNNVVNVTCNWFLSVSFLI